MSASHSTLFGRLLREHRVRRGFTLRTLAEGAACAEVTLRKIERGARRPSRQMARALADALELSTAERIVFLDEAGVQAPSADNSDAMHEQLLALAMSSFHRYPDEVQRLQLDQLEERFAEVRATISRLILIDARAAQRFTGTLAEFWQKRSRMHEGLQMLEQVLLLDATPTDARALALLAAGALCAGQNSYERGRLHIEECLRISETIGLAETRARAMHVRAWLALWGELNQARSITLYEEAMRLYERCGDRQRSAHARCDMALAWAFGSHGDHDFPRAEQQARISLEQFREMACPSGVAFAKHTLTMIYAESGRFTEAETFEAEALGIFRRMGGRRDIAFSLAHLGEIAQMRDCVDQASIYWEEAFAIFLEIGENNGICVALHSLARIARERGQIRQARQKIVAGLRLANRWNRTYVFVHGLYELAGLQLADEEVEDAAVSIGAADALAARLSLEKFYEPIKRFDEWRDAARAQLGEQRFIDATLRGAALSADEVMARAADR